MRRRRPSLPCAVPSAPGAVFTQPPPSFSQEPEGAGAMSPACQKLSAKWCFLDGKWPRRAGSWQPQSTPCLLPGGPGSGQQKAWAWTSDPVSSASSLSPTATTASRFYRIDRAQVSTAVLSAYSVFMFHSPQTAHVHGQARPCLQNRVHRDGANRERGPVYPEKACRVGGRASKCRCHPGRQRKSTSGQGSGCPEKGLSVEGAGRPRTQRSVPRRGDGKGEGGMER